MNDYTRAAIDRTHVRRSLVLSVVAAAVVTVLTLIGQHRFIGDRLVVMVIELDVALGFFAFLASAIYLAGDDIGRWLIDG